MLKNFLEVFGIPKNHLLIFDNINKRFNFFTFTFKIALVVFDLNKLENIFESLKLYLLCPEALPLHMHLLADFAFIP